MSKNSSKANKAAKAKQITAMHKNGEKGPSSTTPLHGKRWGYRNNPEVLKRQAEAQKASSNEGRGEKTAGKKILRAAGGATQA